MDQNTPQTFTPINPLAKHFRQPVIYFKLPSGGAYWAEGALDLPINGQIGVLPMSTKDEITLKTPDGLLNGQGVVSVIQSCCPNIKDAWAMPSIDIDATIIAIRIASYGAEMGIDATCPHCNHENHYDLDLATVLNSVHAPSYKENLVIDGLSIKFKPQSYFDFNKASQISFEEQQILRSISAMEEQPEQASKLFDQHMTRLVDLNISTLTDSTDYITTEDGVIVHDSKFIYEFYQNAQAQTIKAVKAKLEEFSKQGGLKPVSVQCENEECTKSFEVNVIFEFASFFGQGS